MTRIARRIESSDLRFGAWISSINLRDNKMTCEDRGIAVVRIGCLASERGVKGPAK